MNLHRYLIVIGLVTATCLGQESKAPPSTNEPALSRPSERDRERAQIAAPSLSARGDEGTKAALAFIDWAGASSVEQREEVARLLEQARGNEFVANAFCDEANRTIEADPSRSLLVLSLLGEMRTEHGAACFQKLLHLPLPEKGTMANGEIVEQTRLGMLQAKAVDGLAYLHSPKADEEVLWAVGKHESRIVRAEAIEAYLWNHQDSSQAHETLLKYVRPQERIFLDRVRKESTDNADSFNRKLAVFLKEHPEAVPPAPKLLDRKDDESQLPRDNQPPER